MSWLVRVDERLAALEKNAHKPFDFSALIARLETVEASLVGRREVEMATVERIAAAYERRAISNGDYYGRRTAAFIRSLAAEICNPKGKSDEP